jgi:hypothetical protein
MNKKLFLIGIIVIIIVGLGSFYGGIKIGQSRCVSPAKVIMSENVLKSGQDGVIGQTAKQGAEEIQKVGFVYGKIIAKDDSSFTVKERDGKSRVVSFSDSTTFSKFVPSSSLDLSVSENIIASGAIKEDGSIAAWNIDIRSEVQKQ